ncbi:MAG TPA: DUF6069 family protein [Protaetiibacter sp.]|nr:DUF6069 family protein [Protaetiibacter sp.]
MTATVERTTPRASVVALTVLAALVAVGVVTSLIAFVALTAGVGDGFPPLQPQAYLSFALAGTLIALGGWVLIVRFVRRSARLLKVLVPGLFVVTLIPDVVLLVTGFIPGATPGAVIALMLMHPVVAGAAVLAGQRIAPAR